MQCEAIRIYGGQWQDFVTILTPPCSPAFAPCRCWKKALIAARGDQDIGRAVRKFCNHFGRFLFDSEPFWVQKSSTIVLQVPQCIPRSPKIAPRAPRLRKRGPVLNGTQDQEPLRALFGDPEESQKLIGNAILVKNVIAEPRFF